MRRYIVERGFKEQVDFRNLHYPNVLADLVARGGSEERLPALWDGAQLHQGAEACLARLAEHEAAQAGR